MGKLLINSSCAVLKFRSPNVLQITWYMVCNFGGTAMLERSRLITGGTLDNVEATDDMAQPGQWLADWRGGIGGVAERAIEGRLNEYQVIGRHLPTDTNPTPKLYRMRIFAPNTVVAKSRFWYFLMKLRKVKKSNGEIITINLIHEKHPTKVKNFGIWIRYDSRSGTHNMYKEYREMSRTEAVDSLYQDMAARHRARFRSIHILKVVELEKTDDVKRPYVKQLLAKDLKFPLPHRIPKATSKALFAAHRPATFA